MFLNSLLRLFSITIFFHMFSIFVFMQLIVDARKSYCTETENVFRLWFKIRKNELCMNSSDCLPFENKAVEQKPQKRDLCCGWLKAQKITDLMWRSTYWDSEPSPENLKCGLAFSIWFIVLDVSTLAGFRCLVGVTRQNYSAATALLGSPWIPGRHQVVTTMAVKFVQSK